MAGRARRTVLSALAHPLVMLLVFTAALLYVRPALRDAAPCADSLAATLPAGQHEALLRSYESQRSALELLDAQIERAGGDPVLERQRDLMAEDVALLGRACEAEDARELLRAVATYDERLAERGQTAHNGAYLGAEAALYRALAELDDPRVIDNSGEMPAVVYLATNQFALAPVVFAIADLGFAPNPTYDGSLEFLLLVVPLAAASFAGACLSERAAAPVRLRPGGARAVVVGAVCGCAAVAAVALPAAVVSILRNGVAQRRGRACLSARLSKWRWGLCCLLGGDAARPARPHARCERTVLLGIGTSFAAAGETCRSGCPRGGWGCCPRGAAVVVLAEQSPPRRGVPDFRNVSGPVPGYGWGSLDSGLYPRIADSGVRCWCRRPRARPVCRSCCRSPQAGCPSCFEHLSLASRHRLRPVLVSGRPLPGSVVRFRSRALSPCAHPACRRPPGSRPAAKPTETQVRWCQSAWLRCSIPRAHPRIPHLTRHGSRRAGPQLCEGSRTCMKVRECRTRRRLCSRRGSQGGRRERGGCGYL